MSKPKEGIRRVFGIRRAFDGKSLNRQRCSANTKQELLVIFDAEQVYLKVELINLKNMEVTANPKPHTLEKIGLSNTLKPKA